MPMTAESLRALALDAGRAQPGLGRITEVEVRAEMSSLGQTAWFVWMMVARDCETNLLRRAKINLLRVFAQALNSRGDRRQPFVYLLSDRDWARRGAVPALVASDRPPT